MSRQLDSSLRGGTCGILRARRIPFGAFHDHFHDGRDESFILHVEQSIAAITGRQLQNQRVVNYRSSTISDDVGVRQGYLLGSALNSFGV